MGFFNDKEIAGKLATEIYKDINEKIPDLYKIIKEKYYSESGKHAEEWRTIRDWIRADFGTMESIMGRALLDNYTEDEIKAVLKVLFYMRNEKGDIFYRTESETLNSNKSVGAHIKKGSLHYNYEEYCNMLVDKWNELNVNKIVSWYDGFEKRQEWVLDLKTRKNNFILNLHLGNEDSIRDAWECIQQRIDNIYKKIIFCSKHRPSYNLLNYVVCVDVIAGSNRDIMIFLLNQGVMAEEILDDYCDLIRNGMKQMQFDNNSSQYHLFLNYLLHIEMISIRNERKMWIYIQEFLMSETLENTVIQEDEFMDKRTECEKIVRWFINKNQMFPINNEEILMRAVYVECFLCKKKPKAFERNGIKNFLNYINKKTSQQLKNLSAIELFYYEKIIRGIFRENGNLEGYVEQRQNMIKIYKLEIEIFDEKYMNGMYLSCWIEALSKGMEFIVKKYIV